jgi:hypothetical protein
MPHLILEDKREVLPINTRISIHQIRGGISAPQRRQ